MRFKTFLYTYFLFVLLIVTILGIVSVYLTNTQITILKKKSEADFKIIATSLSKDISVLSSRNIDKQSFKDSVNFLVDGYSRYYKKNNISLELDDLSKTFESSKQQTELYFTKQQEEDFINIRGMLTEPFHYYCLNYSGNISNNIYELKSIQKVLLFLALFFSFITALFLYIILSSIFMPLDIVSKISSKIADGKYNERIIIKGQNELSSMAKNFNRMATEIEKQILLLEDDAIQKQQFVNNFAHEIRTPLTSIYGYAEYMIKVKLDEYEIIESAQLIMNEASYMRKISDSLLELATLHQYNLVLQEVNLPKLFATVTQSLIGFLPEKQCKVIYDCDVQILFCKEDLLRSLLLNLGVNALKACKESYGIVKLEAKEEKGYIILSVTDNGCGIPKESIPNVTKPFYRIDKARSRDSGGVGLGLTLCMQIAHAHNAQMCINSVLNQGTKVEIIFTTP